MGVAAGGPGFGHEAQFEGETVEWYTPPEIFVALGEHFDLDPCSPGEGKSFVPATKHLTIADDGLTAPWEGFVFMNPPYGPATTLWMERLAQHGNGIALVFARTDVTWCQKYAPQVSEICFVRGRIYFYKGNTVIRGGRPGAGSMFMSFGERGATALRRSDLGFCASQVGSRHRSVT